MIELVLDALDKEDELIGEPFSGRAGRLFLKLANQAGIEEHELIIVPISPAYQPFSKNIVILAGNKARKMFKMDKEEYGTFNFNIVSWYSPSYILQRGKSIDKLTVEFLKQVKEKHERIE